MTTKSAGKKKSVKRKVPRSLGLGGVAIAAFLGAVAGGGTALAISRGYFDLPALGVDWETVVREPRFHARRLEFIGLEHIAAPELAERADVRPGTPLVDVDALALAARVGEHPRVAEVTAARVPPDRIVVRVEEREPVAVRADGMGVDRSGAAFPIDAEEAGTLPGLRGTVHAALPLLDAASESGVPVAEIDTSDGLRFRPVGRAASVRVGADAHGALLNWVELRASGLVDYYDAGEVDLRFQGTAVLRDFPDEGGVESGTP